MEWETKTDILLQPSKPDKMLKISYIHTRHKPSILCSHVIKTCVISNWGMYW